MNKFTELLNDRILFLDGAMGTMIQRHKLEEADYRGERFADWPSDLKGNNDLLVLTQPHLIEEIHRRFLEAGADMVVLADHATGSLISPAHYEELLLAYHKIICAEVAGPLILHVCGPCGDRLKLFASTGIDAYHFEYQVGPKFAVDEVGDAMLCPADTLSVLQSVISPRDPQDLMCLRAVERHSGDNLSSFMQHASR